ncbi:MAG: N-acetylneuraminate synthase, partial [Deltaproteobacteria bacterium]|nr:N-acetylneuraminate synthase [Deltaproteobacteria bacterium]
VKFQTFKAEKVVTRSAPQAEYQARNTGKVESQYDMLKRLELDAEAHRKIASYCRKKKIIFLSSPFDEESATLLAYLGVNRIKLPSGEISNLPFLAHVARLQKPILLSTGMAYLAEVDDAVRTIQKEWQKKNFAGSAHGLTLLHCLTEYPAPMEEVNLKAMITLREAFQLPVGYSDHTLGIEIALAAAALGAAVIEKHFTLDRTLPGPDHQASLEPAELKKMVVGVRNIERALGNGIKAPAESELKNRDLVRKSLLVTRNFKAGHRLQAGDLAAKRPGGGISPGQKKLLVGAVLQKSIARDTLLTWDHLLKH